MGVYDSFVTLADDLISHFGGACLLEQPATSGQADDDTAWLGNSTPPATVNVTAAFPPAMPGDKQHCYIAADNMLILNEGMTIYTASDKRYSIESSSVVRPDGLTRIYYDIVVTEWPT